MLCVGKAWGMARGWAREGPAGLGQSRGTGVGSTELTFADEAMLSVAVRHGRQHSGWNAQDDTP